MAPPDGPPPSIDRLVWRQEELEKRLESFEGKIERGFAGIEARFDRLGAQVSTLAYPSMELYRSEQAAQDRAIAGLAALVEGVEERMGKRLDGAEGSNRATLTLLIGAILTAIVAALVRMAIG